DDLRWLESTGANPPTNSSSLRSAWQTYPRRQARRAGTQTSAQPFPTPAASLLGVGKGWETCRYGLSAGGAELHPSFHCCSRRYGKRRSYPSIAQTWLDEE